MAKRIFNYTVNFIPADGGGYIAEVPALEGCCSQGETLEEAETMIRDAIKGYIESLIKHGEPVPRDIRPIQKQIRLKVG